MNIEQYIELREMLKQVPLSHRTVTYQKYFAQVETKISGLKKAQKIIDFENEPESPLAIKEPYERPTKLNPHEPGLANALLRHSLIENHIPESEWDEFC
jgi:uncharacterized FAD-dependent dehydrogenase